ncbi:MAG: hypothetical protein ABSC42_04110 [Tepidisphaeraceae bacterium]|jgi:hypothetical protein
MTGPSSQTSRPQGRALIVGQPAYRGGPAASLHRRGFVSTEVDEPYEAMVQLCKHPLFFSTIVLSLNSLYREELPIIACIKRRFSHIDIWLSDTDGRQAALAEAMRQGADGLFADDGLHRIAPGSPVSASEIGFPPPATDMPNAPTDSPDPASQPEKCCDPLLTAEELRALLHETPSPNPG